MFKPKNGVRSRYRVALRLDDAERRRLDIDYLPDRINGPMGVDLTYSAFDAGRAQIEALLDLSATSLSVAEAGWNKAPDVPGAAKLVLDLANEQVTGLREIEVKSLGRLANAVERYGSVVAVQDSADGVSTGLRLPGEGRDVQVLRGHSLTDGVC